MKEKEYTGASSRIVLESEIVKLDFKIDQWNEMISKAEDTIEDAGANIVKCKASIKQYREDIKKIRITP